METTKPMQRSAPLPMTAAPQSKAAAAPAPTRQEQLQQRAAARKLIRARQPNFGGERLQLTVHGTVTDYHLYWANDDSVSLEKALYQGFEFVHPDDLEHPDMDAPISQIVPDADVTDRISRYVGPKADGTPMRAYLMMLPEEEWLALEAQRYAEASAREQDIYDGRVHEGDGRRTLKGVKNSIEAKRV